MGPGGLNTTGGHVVSYGTGGLASVCVRCLAQVAAHSCRQQEGQIGVGCLAGMGRGRQLGLVSGRIYLACVGTT